MNAYRTPKKKSLWERIISNSFLLSLLTFLSVKLHNLLAGSFVMRMFTVSEKCDKARKSGFFANFVSFPFMRRFIPAVRRGFSEEVEKSVFVSWYRKLIKALITCSVRSLGVFLLSASLYSVLGMTIDAILNGISMTRYNDATICLLALLVSLFMLSSTKSFGEKLCESRILSTVVFDFLGVNPIAVDKTSSPKNHYAVGLFAGLACGVFSFFASPLKVTAFIIGFIVFATILYSPESGLLLSAVLIPFESNLIFFISALSLVSYLLKLFRGKRNFTVKSEDVPMLFMSVLFVIAFPNSSVLHLLIIVSSYFMASNLLRSKQLLSKAASCVSLGLAIRAFTDVLSLSCSHIIDKKLITAQFISGFIINDNVSFGLFTIVTLLGAFYTLSNRESRFSPLFKLVYLICAIVLTVLSSSDIIWLYSLIALLIFFVYRTRHLYNVTFYMLLAMPFLLFARDVFGMYNNIVPFSTVMPSIVMPDTKSFLFGGSIYGEGTYGIMISSYGIIGCAVFVLTLYLLLSRSFTSSMYQRHGLNDLCGVCVTIIAVFFIAGISINTFSSDRYLLLFLLCCGIISATGNVIPSAEVENDYI